MFDFLGATIIIIATLNSPLITAVMFSMSQIRNFGVRFVQFTQAENKIDYFNLKLSGKFQAV